MHEMSHHYLAELGKLAKAFPQSEAARDYETIMQWASWEKGQVKAYAGTASAKEFQARDEAIRKAEEKGDTLEIKRLKDVWAQERFARAFEEYLHSGEAPTSVLKQIFRRFKRWISDIYKTVAGAGVRATAEVEAVMARMVATDAEIEAELTRENFIAMALNWGNAGNRSRLIAGTGMTKEEIQALFEVSSCAQKAKSRCDTRRMAASKSWVPRTMSSEEAYSSG